MESSQNKSFFALMRKIPGGIIIVPLFIGVILNTTIPDALQIGGFTQGLFKGGTSCLLGLFLLLNGASIDIRHVGMPFYKGVVSMGDNSVNIRVMVLCAEADRIQMERDLNREMKLLFDKYNINIPYPQIVVNKPATFQEATVLEKYKSQQFAREQREASGGYVEEDEEEN